MQSQRKLDGLVVVLFLIALTLELWIISKPAQIEKVEQQQAPRYVYYFPVFIRPPGLYGKGIASTAGGAFNKELGASWYYTWSMCDAPGCVPMIRNWDALPPTCPPIILLGNEPNSREPYGHSEPPEEASKFSMAVRAHCPSSWLVVGNVALPEFLGISGYDWLQRYIDAGGQYDQLGAHCYSSPNGNAGQCIKALSDLELYFPGVPKCITEYNSYNAKLETFAELNEYIEAHYSCRAAFTDHDEDWDVYQYDLNLIKDDGSLTERGKLFAGTR